MLNKKIHPIKEKKFRYFGTDGIRGKVGVWPMTAEFFLKLGWAAGQVLTTKENNKILLGKDTRLSGHLFESALQAGLSAAGVNTHLIGTIPTPAISYLTRELGMTAGIVITASHNPRDDNGIKFFSSQGYKISDAAELAIEEKLNQTIIPIFSSALGKVIRVDDAEKKYIDFCKATIPANMTFKNLKIVVDCANGSTYRVAPTLLRELNANVIEIGTYPDGLNINLNCGALKLETLQKTVLQEKADLGLAFDGDGDRLMMVDYQGRILDGDELLYIIVKNQLTLGLFKGGVVGTVMTNLGLEEALTLHGIEFVRAQVGDRYVMEEMLKHNWQIGGEPAGHIICNKASTTGDGMLSALQVLSAMCYQHKSLAELKFGFKKYPQTLINVKVRKEDDPNEIESIQEAIKKAKKTLGENSRIVIRRSGTEPVVRVMIEGKDSLLIQQLSLQIAKIVKNSLG